MTTPATPIGPATVAAVAGWLAVPEGHSERDHIASAVAAVNSWLSTFHTADPVTGEYTPHVVQGAVQLAARITRRRNSPAGVEAFGELGATYVSRYDPDLDRLLALGAYRPLIVG